MRLRDFLHRHKQIALDTSIFIYQLENNPRYTELTDHIFTWLERSNHAAVTSTITMAELLVQQYRLADDQQVDEYYALLSTYPNLKWIPPSLLIADTAARIRAAHGLRTPDAFQAATALGSEATGFVTNDSVFERVSGLEILVLERLL